MSQDITSHAERVEMIERHLGGETLLAIATGMQCNYYTVRKWWRVYRREGWASLIPLPQGPPQVGILGHFSPLVKYVALRLKREHPGWGVDKLLLEMRRRPSLQGHVLPKRSVLAAYLRQFGNRLRRPRHGPTRRPQAPLMQAQAPHQCWQMDFKGEEVVGGCGIVIAPLMVCDEASGAPLAGIVHEVKAKGNRSGVTMGHVQQDLRSVFARWGLPDALRMDRDPVFVGSTHLLWPSTLLLWLVGLGVQPIINRAYRPTDNALVERNHWSWELHVLLGQTYPDGDHVQQTTAQSFADRRDYLPSRHQGCHGQPPAQAFPTLGEPRRPYSPAREDSLFDLQRVDAYLSQWEWRRTVDSMGKISLANRTHYIGKAYKGQTIKIHFDLQTRKFVCTAADGTEMARLTLPEVSQEYILRLGHDVELPGGGTT